MIETWRRCKTVQVCDSQPEQRLTKAVAADDHILRSESDRCITHEIWKRSANIPESGAGDTGECLEVPGLPQAAAAAAAAFGELLGPGEPSAAS